MKPWALLAGLALGTVAFTQEIHLKSRTIDTATSARGIRPRSVAPKHRIVQFLSAPGIDEVSSIIASGAQVVSVLPENAVVISAGDDRSAELPGIRWTGAFEPADKLSPDLAHDTTAELKTFDVIVEFYRDVPVSEQDAMADALGIGLQRGGALLPNHALVRGTWLDLSNLASRDQVAYIFPADAGLMSDAGVNPCLGMVTLAGPVAQNSNVLRGWTPDPGGMTRLGYYFASLTAKVPASLVQTEVLRAFNEWARYAAVTFAPAAALSPRSIAIRFVAGSHGDPYPFDGPGGSLAHTFYPVPLNAEPLAGDMHLDADEPWKTGGDIDIYSVALHEAGHALGLGHSDRPGDVMYPYYRRGMTLSSRDIAAVRAFYGVPGGVPPALITAAPAASALQLTINPPQPSTTASTASLSGSLSGGVAPFAVQWQSDRGYSGAASLISTGPSSTGWAAPKVALEPGGNWITVTIVDSAHRASTQVVAVTRTVTAPASGALPVAVSLVSPTSSVVQTSASSTSLAGTASGGTGITRINWLSSSGISGTAVGTEHWVISNIPVYKGINTILLRAFDSSGTSAWTSVQVDAH